MKSLNSIIGQRYSAILTPRKKGSSYHIPYYGKDSKYFMLFKSFALSNLQRIEAYPDEDLPVPELLSIFKTLPKDHKIETAYNLSHELKVATKALELAKESPESRVFEIGSDYGFGAYFYSTEITGALNPEDAAYKLNATEHVKERYKVAMDLKKTLETGMHLDNLNFECSDGVRKVLKESKDGDIVFSSVAEPDVCKRLSRATEKKRFKLMVTYSELTKDKLEKDMECPYESTFDEDAYYIDPFEDVAFNKNCEYEFPRFGLLAQPR